jgi:hypothetical protein
VSGTILTTGNLVGLPSLRIPAGNLLVGGNSSMEGSITLGDMQTTTTGSWYTWINGSVGMRFSSAGKDGADAKGVLKLSMPMLGGKDIAIRNYLVQGVDQLEVDVQVNSACLLLWLTC